MIAERDIITYRVVRRPQLGVYFGPYIGEVFNIKHKDDKGVYSYLDYKQAVKLQRCFGPTSIVKCKIPKGVEYWTNETRNGTEHVSKELNIIDWY